MKDIYNWPDIWKSISDQKFTGKLNPLKNGGIVFIHVNCTELSQDSYSRKLHWFNNMLTVNKKMEYILI